MRAALMADGNCELRLSLGAVFAFTASTMQRSLFLVPLALQNVQPFLQARLHNADRSQNE